ncbi:negative regulator of vesicle formation-related [Holotrichia oblita]|uniref:Negative regulator of vesicle formation-related n=1 Tax=Holotrichia oblita TaxID=644536 RepID=A0ACB9SNM0_HOLOL|nr:negative regulator of vesicle formation-related [Holotrichia oblita]
MVFLNKFIFISLLAACGFFYGLLLFLSDYEENKCEMTYMFQYPQFVRISMKIDNHFKKYGLYAYSEGHFTERARKMQFNGIPVLFIPGNAGSYKQARSLASVALRKAIDSRLGHHFDYFTIDFNDELSALNGVLLYDQVLYAQQSIYRILELYASNKNKPTSVVLVGHSMNSGIRIDLQKQYELSTPIDDTGDWIEHLPRQYSVELIEGTKRPHWYMIRRVNQPMHEVLSIMALNLELSNWIFACTATIIKDQSRVCVDAVHLSQLSEIAPSVKYKRRFLNINLYELNSNFTHVIVRVPSTSEPITLHVDVHSEADRKISAKLSSWSLKKEVIIQETSPNTVYYEIHFPDLNHVIQSYELFVEPLQCKVQTHHASASLSVPWSNLDYHVIFTDTQNNPMHLRLYSNKPSNMTNISPFVKLLLDPNCKYTVSVKLAIPNMFAQFARFYSPFIFANVVVITLLTLKSQLFSMDSKGRCSLFFTALMTDTKPYYVLPVAKITGLILGSSAVVKMLSKTDLQILDEEGISFGIMMFLYISSIGIVWILTMILAVSIFCFESTVYKIFLKIISRSVTGTMTMYDWILKGMKKFPSFVAILLLSLSISTCGGLSLALGLIFYFFKLTQIAQDVVENIVMKLVKIIMNKLKLRPQLQVRIQNLVARNPQREAGGDKIQNVAHVAPGSTNQQNEIDRRVNSTESDTSANSIEGNTAQPEKNNLFSVLEEITDNNELYFHFTIFCLWFLVTCINIPTVLMWAHNFKYNTRLDADPSFIPGFMLCTCALALWQFEYPLVEKKWYKELGYIVYILTVFSFMYGIFSIYRLNYVLSIVITLITLHQIFAPLKNVPQISSVEDSDKYEKAKVKME